MIHNKTSTFSTNIHTCLTAEKNVMKHFKIFSALARHYQYYKFSQFLKKKKTVNSWFYTYNIY